MPALSRDKHKKFCTLITEIKKANLLSDDELNELHQQLEIIYNTYKISVNEIKVLITEYETKQKLIRNKVKILLKNTTIKQKKTPSFA